MSRPVSTLHTFDDVLEYAGFVDEDGDPAHHGQQEYAGHHPSRGPEVHNLQYQ